MPGIISTPATLGNGFASNGQTAIDKTDRTNGINGTNGTNGHAMEGSNGTNHRHESMAFTDARLAKGPSEHLLKYDSIPLLEKEKEHFDQYCQVDLAHLTMLVEQGIVSKADARELLPVLLGLRERGVANLPIDPLKGSLLLQIEAFVANEKGEPLSGKVHTGRSRIDQGVTARRLFERGRLLEVMQGIATFEDQLLVVAQRHLDTVMPVYTHMQHAQPGTFGHFLLGYVERLGDDFDHCKETFARVNRSVLGCTGLSGTSWPIDRLRTADLLGFDGLVQNSRLAREAYYSAEMVSSLSFIMATLNDLATDLHLWSTAEFNFVESDDGYCSTSSIFPQKKNPSALEVIKHASGPAVNWGGSALAIFRSEGTGDQGIRRVNFESALQTTIDMLDLSTGILGSIQVHEDRMLEALQESWCTASNLADALVRKTGVSFRSAHHVVGRLVRLATQGRVGRSEVGSDLLNQASLETLGHPIEGFTSTDISDALDPIQFVSTRISMGSPGSVAAMKLLDKLSATAREHADWLDNKVTDLKEAEIRLSDAIQAILH